MSENTNRVEITARTNMFLITYSICNDVSNEELMKMVSNHDTLSFVDRLYETGYSDDQMYVLFDMYYKHEEIPFILFHPDFTSLYFKLVRKCLQRDIPEGYINKCGGSITNIVNLYTNF